MLLCSFTKVPSSRLWPCGADELPVILTWRRNDTRYLRPCRCPVVKISSLVLTGTLTGNPVLPGKGFMFLCCVLRRVSEVGFGIPAIRLALWAHPGWTG